ncbi:MAG: hypothetical protein KDD62_08290, partial [Bdellovibrionales bacterium]|nr:hypothetical protein [Bdellovibrionales bacterium]
MKILNLAKKSVPDSAGESGTIVDPKLLKQVRTTQWKRLINQISTLQSQRSFRSLCITSPRSGEGKTLTSNMIALGYVQQLNKRVLL